MIKITITSNFNSLTVNEITIYFDYAIKESDNVFFYYKDGIAAAIKRSNAEFSDILLKLRGHNLLKEDFFLEDED